MFKRFVIIAAFLALPGLARATEQMPATLTAAPDQASTVQQIIDGDTLVLASGREVRMVGIQAPKLPLGRPHFEKWPLADEAKQTLEGFALGQQVVPFYGSTETDRHNRSLAHLQTLSSVWLQQAMLRAGMARVYSFPDNRLAIAPLLQAEKMAREEGKGIWAHPFYQVRDALKLAKGKVPVGQFLLVEGRVSGVTHRYEKTFINFEEDWRTDFSLELPAKNRHLFATENQEEKAALSALEGQRVRVRGWISKKNGPMMRLTHPEQIERLEE